MSKGLPDQLKRARRSALKRVASQLGATGPAADPALGALKGDAFQSQKASPVPTYTPFPTKDTVNDWTTLTSTVAVSSVDREQVLTAAAQLFSRGGFRKVSLDEVAAHAGVAPRAVRAICRSKEELLYLAVSREVDIFLSEARAWVDEKTGFLPLLQRISEASFEYIGHRPLVLQLALGLLSECAPGWEDRFHSLRQRFGSVVGEVVRIGVAQGLVRSDVDLEMTTSLLFELHVSSYVLHLQDTPDKKDRAARRRAAALDLVFNGLKAR